MAAKKWALATYIRAHVGLHLEWLAAALKVETRDTFGLLFTYSWRLPVKQLWQPCKSVTRYFRMHADIAETAKLQTAKTIILSLSVRHGSV